jgi:hypothetical protein
MRCADSPALNSSSVLPGFQPERGNHLEQQFLTQPAIHRGTTEAQAGLSTVVVISLQS